MLSVMQEMGLFIVMQLAFIAMSFWEAYMEGKDGWAKRQCGWKLYLPFSKEGHHITAYHFWLFGIFMPILIFAVPFVLVGFSMRLFILLLISFIVGSIIEDFTWFVVNPKYPFKKWNPKDTKWHKWIKIGKLNFPISYLIGLMVAGILLYIMIYHI